MHTRYLSILVCAVLLAAAGCATQPSQPTASVWRLKGSNQWSGDGGMTWHTLSPRQQLPAGLVLRTTAASRIDLQFGTDTDAIRALPHSSPRDFDTHPASPTSRQIAMPTEQLRVQGSSYSPYSADPRHCLVRLWEDSILGIDLLPRTTGTGPSAGEAQFSLRAGHVFLHTTNNWGGTVSTITFPGGIVHLQPGTYNLGVDGLLKVHVGEAVVTMTDSGKTKTVPAGYKFDARTWETISLSELTRESMP